MQCHLEIRNHNVLFITVDSCRYDTAQNARLDYLNSITKLRKAETSGTYTLPAHCSFFLGILPNITEGTPNYIGDYTQIWRSGLAKNRSKNVGLYYREKNIIDYYLNNNYQVIGAGGVSFFSNKQGNYLPSLFPRFITFQKPVNTKSEANVPRSLEQFPLENIPLIAEAINGQDPYFIFINSVATHIPYDHPNAEITNSYKDLIKKMYQIDYRKSYNIPEDMHLSNEEILTIKKAQITSLEWVDSKIKELIKILPTNQLPTLLLVCGDHGEELGDNKRYGHGHAHETVTTVPLWCTMINS